MLAEGRADEGRGAVVDGSAPSEGLDVGHRSRTWLIPVALLHAVLAAPAIWHALFEPDTWAGPTDWQLHSTLGVELTFPTWWNPGMPHFLLHVLARGTTWSVGSDDPRVGMLVVSLTLCAAWGALLAGLIARALGDLRYARAIAIVASFALAFGEAPSVLLGWSYEMPPGFFLPLNMPHSPTAMASRVTSLLLFLAVWRFLQDPASRLHRWMPLLVAAAVFTKPALAPPLGIAAVGWIWWCVPTERRRATLQRFAWSYLVPMSVFLAVQFAIIQHLPPEYVQSVGIAPFAEFGEMGAGNPLFWTVFIVPVYAFVRFGPAIRRGPAGLAAGATGVAFVMATLLTTPGGIQYSGEMLHFLQHGVLIWTVISVVEVARLYADDRARWGRPALVVGLLLVPGIVGGWTMWSCHGGGACLVR